MTSILTALKEKGNEAFVRGDYEAAILCYSEGLEKLKDMKVLYTSELRSVRQGCVHGISPGNSSH